MCVFYLLSVFRDLKVLYTISTCLFFIDVILYKVVWAEDQYIYDDRVPKNADELSLFESCHKINN